MSASQANDPRNDLRARLRRLGLRRGTDHIRPPAPKPASPPPANDPEPPAFALPPGYTPDTPFGPTYIIRESYPPDHRHGPYTLSDLLSRSAAQAADFLRRADVVDLPLHKLVFLDTETTGLMGGAGTLAFLVGIGFFDDTGFVLEQYFLRDPAEEAAMLHLLAERLNHASGLVTFNGRSFDVPLLLTRYLLNRLDHAIDFGRLPNLDLLFPSRRIWQGRLENCRLGTLETDLLDHNRTADDVPGFLIPELYNRYLMTGDTRDMHRVLYHNREDILSMVSLSTYLIDFYADPLSTAHSSADCLRLARWFEDSGRPTDAEAAYHAALTRPAAPDTHREAHHRLALLLKRLKRRDDARHHWEALAALETTTTDASVELAIYYEWHQRDFAQALTWTETAMQRARQHPVRWRRQTLLADLQHRHQRLARKQQEAGP